MTIMKAARTHDTPELVFDPAAGSLYMEGECYPENPALFFQPFLATLQAHFDRQLPATFHARIRLSYVNSASTKSMRHLFLILNEAAKGGCSIDIDWEFDQDDDATQDLGEDLMYGLGIPYLRFNEVPFVA
jgi:hypothetical protein